MERVVEIELQRLKKEGKREVRERESKREKKSESE